MNNKYNNVNNHHEISNDPNSSLNTFNIDELNGCKYMLNNFHYTACYDTILKNKKIKTRYINCYKKILLILKEKFEQNIDCDIPSEENSHFSDSKEFQNNRYALLINEETNNINGVSSDKLNEKIRHEHKSNICHSENEYNGINASDDFQCDNMCKKNENENETEFNEKGSDMNEYNNKNDNEEVSKIQENDELKNFNDKKDEITECNYDEDLNIFYVKDEMKVWNETDEINELEERGLRSLVGDDNNELDEADIKDELSIENNENTLRISPNEVDVKNLNDTNENINSYNLTNSTNANSINTGIEVKGKNKNLHKIDIRDRGRKRKKNELNKKNDELVKVYGDIIKDNTTSFLYKNFVIPKKSHNYNYLTYKEIKEYLKNLTVLKSGANWKTYKIEDLPSELYKNIRPINQRVTGFKTVLLVDELFEKLWEFPLTDMIKIRTVTRGDQFIGDIRIDFYYRQSERTLCRACGRHILKQKFATEHYQRNINCWKEVMWRLGIPELHYYNSVRNDFFDPRIMSIDNNNEQVLLDRALLLYNQELIRKATEFVNGELKYYEENSINKEPKKNKGSNCLELDILVLDDNNILLPTMKSELDEPYFEISAIYPSNGFSDENYSKNFCFIKITFNKIGGMVLRDLFTLECEFLVDWGDNLLIQAKKYTLHEIYSSSDTHDVNLRNLYDQGFAYLRCNVPQKSYGKVSLKVRIPKTVWHYWEAIADETSKVSYEFLDKNYMHRHLLFCSYLDNINKNITEYIKSSYKNNYTFDISNNSSNFSKGEDDFSQRNNVLLDKKEKFNLSEQINNKIVPYNFNLSKAEMNYLNSLNPRLLYNQNNTYNNIEFPFISCVPYQTYQNFNMNVQNDSETNCSKDFDHYNNHRETNFQS